ncbi:hypothetical protein BOTCAL_0302g00150 [Botryotinia calthae]|uniref:Uncharacterized protein n=1 Tax=Botryotinia calthae TaxID=38488 RepID=A0A4Y8CUC2_9HELO|nr:hypothetical protein BOTCAL_0302g00150 [Botryotinia calthae]
MDSGTKKKGNPAPKRTLRNLSVWFATRNPKLSFSSRTLLFALDFFGIWVDWNVGSLGLTARYVRYCCGSADYERATENKRTELEWWIEGILKDNSDSFALAEERRRIIIAPLQKMVRKNTFCEGFAMGAQKAHARREMARRICSDCESAHCCLSKSVKLQ